MRIGHVWKCCPWWWKVEVELKLVGINMKDYKWCALSPNDPIQVPMRYHSKENAEHHAAVMNELIPLWEENIGKIWNRDY